MRPDTGLPAPLVTRIVVALDEFLAGKWGGAVGERLRHRFGAGTVFVPLDAVTDPGLVLAAIGRAAGADLARTGSPAEALAETFGDGAWLLILDNLEQVVQVAPDLGELLARCPQL